MRVNTLVSMLAAAIMALMNMGWMQRALARDGVPAVRQMDAMPGMSDANMDDMNMDSMDKPPVSEHGSSSQGVTTPRLRDPHAYSDGYDFGPIPRPSMAHERSFASLLINRLEWVHPSGASTAAYDLQAWYGRDYDRVVLKAEGNVDNGEVQDGRAEVLWGHAVSPFWDAQLGLRYDHGVDPERSWLAVGVQGLAPYWFETNVTAYAGDKGRTALRLDGEYDLLLTQRLVLQPRLEMNFYGKGDMERGQGSGLSELAAGLRLRYEIRREFAPYLGVEWTGKYGGSADYARAAGESTEAIRLVAGVRLWF